MSFADRIEKAALIDMAEYPERVKYILTALDTCERNHIPVGSRLDKIVTLYNNWYGQDHFSHTSCDVTDEAEILALIIDHVGIDKEHLIKHAPLLAAHYETFKNSRLRYLDTKPLYDFLKPELE